MQAWTRHKYGVGAKHHYISNNAAESFNKSILEDRGKAYVDLIDCVRQKMMIRLDKRRRHAEKMRGRHTPRVTKYIQWACKAAVSAGNVYRSANEEAEVQGEERCTVNLETRTCSCRMWQVSGLPCLHAVAFILSLRRNVSDYIDDYFLLDKYKAAYVGSIAPLPDKKFWQSVKVNPQVAPLIVNRPRGRPRTKTIRDPTESISHSGVNKSMKTCGRCGALGHNKRRCKEPLLQPSNTGASSDPSGQSSSAGSARSRGRGRGRVGEGRGRGRGRGGEGRGRGENASTEGNGGSAGPIGRGVNRGRGGSGRGGLVGIPPRGRGVSCTQATRAFVRSTQ